MLTQSVAVVRKMLEAVAGSKPNFLSTSGIVTPEIPLTMQLAVMATKTVNARRNACSPCLSCCMLA